jgi:hypothetical protein
VVDVRADPKILRRFTKALVDLGFRSAGISAEGLEHRWTRGDASIDVLLPEGVGERSRARLGISGSPTLSTEGGSQALARTAIVAVTGRTSSCSHDSSQRRTFAPRHSLSQTAVGCERSSRLLGPIASCYSAMPTQMRRWTA